MARRYKTTGTGVTTNRDEARANRRLQLISVSGTRTGKTLLEKMEMALDKALKERQEIMGVADDVTLARSEGKVQGMLVQLAIMRTTTSKVELTRARARIRHGSD
jgi:hypothetical protein